MKKYLIFASALLLTVSCAKHATERPDDFSDAPWAVDESVPVPILLSSGDQVSVKTKAPIADLSGIQFGVLALDTLEVDSWSPEDESVVLYNRTAVKGADGFAQFITPQGNVTYYYPLKTAREHNYTFYGYHTSDVTIQEDASVFNGAFEDGTFKKSVIIDSVDVLWAKAKADSIDHEISGFNTKYARQSRLRYPSEWRTAYTPKFIFKHLTTAFHFQIVADPEDPAAAASFLDENGEVLVTVGNLRVSEVYQQASLDVLTGQLTPVGEKGTTYIDAAPMLPLAEAKEVGTGLFLLTENANEGLRLNFDITFPNPGIDTPKTFTPEGGYPLNPPTAAGFEAGKSYTYRIIVKSLERILIQLELEPWEIAQWGAETDNIVATIGE